LLSKIQLGRPKLQQEFKNVQMIKMDIQSGLFSMTLKMTLLVSLFTSIKFTRAQDTVAFYFAAHEDDWQLFMNPNAYYDVHRASTKVVFVYLTAGDAGLGLGKGEGSQPYYLARENGAKVSVKFMVDAEKELAIPIQTSFLFSVHPINKWIYQNTVSYFLRLPDGNPEGTGYSTTGLQSLKRLRDRAISRIFSIDSSTSYQGWDDLRSTIRALIDQERGKATSVWVNLPDTNMLKNVGDHQDHQHTVKCVLEGILDLPCINKVFYLNYATAKLPVNMNAVESQIEVGTFGALVAGVTALDNGSPWDQLHRSWLSRHYFRTERGTGKCQTSH
jgi:hypothetical protein